MTMTYHTLVRVGLAGLILVLPCALRAQEEAVNTDTKVVDTAKPKDAKQTPTLRVRNPRYQLCKGDVVEVNFSVTPEFNQILTVQPDGYITLRYVGDVHVEGQTIPELTQTLQNAYKDILHEPEISIVLKDFEKPYFIVGGQVLKPGKYDLRGDTTVVEALQIAGGMNEDAKHSQVYLFRRVSNDWFETTKLNVKKMMHSGDLAEDLHLRPGDMVFVPKNTYSKIQRFIPTPGIGTFIPIPRP